MAVTEKEYLFLKFCTALLNLIKSLSQKTSQNVLGLVQTTKEFVGQWTITKSN